MNNYINWFIWDVTSHPCPWLDNYIPHFCFDGIIFSCPEIGAGSWADLAGNHYSEGNRTIWLQLQPSSSWQRRRKRSKMFSFCTTHITRTILLGYVWILDFHFKIVLVLRRRSLIPIPCNNDKRKTWPWRWLCHFDFQHWRWLHVLMTKVTSVPAGDFYTHIADPLQTNMDIGCMIVVKCDTCKIFSAYAQLDSWTTSIMSNAGNRHSM